MTILTLIIGILLVLGAIAYIAIKSYNKATRNKAIPIGLILSGLLVIVISQSFVIIPTGHTGVKIIMGQVEEKSISPGFSMKAPFIETISSVNNKIQDAEISSGDTKIDAAAKGKIPINITNVKVSYQINAQRASWLYSNLADPDNLITFDLASSAIKNSTILYNIDEVTVRATVEAKSKEFLQQYVNDKYGKETVTIVQVIVGSINFEDDFNKSVDEKNKAQQEYEKAQTANKQALEKTKNEANMKREEAKGKADAALLEANGIAKANKKLSASLNDKIIANNWIVAWDGKMPLVTDSSGNMIDISKLIQKEEKK